MRGPLSEMKENTITAVFQTGHCCPQQAHEKCSSERKYRRGSVTLHFTHTHMHTYGMYVMLVPKEIIRSIE
jgi:hypothetical protein